MKALIFTATVLAAVPAFAGGSISKDEALSEICSESAALCKTFQALEVSDDGSALRAGRHLPNGGARLMPYTFYTNDSRSLVIVDRDENGKLTLIVQ